MNRFAKVILASTACLTLSVAMVAQEAQTTGHEKKTDAQHEGHMRGKMGRMDGAQHMNKMSKELGLSESQKTQLKSLHEQQRAKGMEIRKNESLTKEQKMEQMKALHESTQSQMNSLLTPEQQTKFATMKGNRKNHMGKHGKGRRGAWGDKTETEGAKPDSTKK